MWYEIAIIMNKKKRELPTYFVSVGEAILSLHQLIDSS